MRRRVVITGMGAVTPIGIGLEEYWRGLLEGRNGVGPITLFDPSPYPTRIAAEVKNWDPEKFIDRKRARRLSRGAQFGVTAALMALEDSAWEDTGNPRVGVVGGVATSPQDAIEEAVEVLQTKGYSRSSPFTLLKCFANSAAAETGYLTGFKDKIITISTACTSGLNSVAEAASLIQSGILDAVLAIGTDSLLSKYVYGYFCRAGLLTPSNSDPKHASRPFDAKRDGGVLGEGAGAVLLESLENAKVRGSKIYCEVIGWGSTAVSNSANPEIDIPHGISAVINEALSRANCSANHIDYIGCHGVSDPHLDIWETRAIKATFRENAYNTPMSSVKSMIGIPTCAAGTLQLISTVLAMNRGIVPATTNYEFPDPQCDLDYIPNTPRRMSITTSIVLAHGLGGSDSAIVVRRGKVS